MARKRKAEQPDDAGDALEDVAAAAADAEAPARNTNRREEQAALARRYAVLSMHVASPRSGRSFGSFGMIKSLLQGGSMPGCAGHPQFSTCGPAATAVAGELHTLPTLAMQQQTKTTCMLAQTT